MSDDGNHSSVGDEQEYKDYGSVSLGYSHNGTRSDKEYPSDVDKEGRHGSDARALSDSCERLEEEIEQHGVYMHYPNGDGDKDDCPPQYNCIVCGPKRGHLHVPQPNLRHHTRLNGKYTFDDCRPMDADQNDYYLYGNNSRVGCSDESKGDCREMDVDDIYVYSDRVNNSNAGCTDENDGYSSDVGYTSDRYFGDG